MSLSDPELLVLEAVEKGLPRIVEDDSVVSRAFLIELIQNRLLTGEVIPCDIGPSVMNVNLTIAGKRRLDELRQIARSKTISGRIKQTAKYILLACAADIVRWIWRCISP